MPRPKYDRGRSRTKRYEESFEYANTMDSFEAPWGGEGGGILDSLLACAGIDPLKLDIYDYLDERDAKKNRSLTPPKKRGKSNKRIDSDDGSYESRTHRNRSKSRKSKKDKKKKRSKSKKRKGKDHKGGSRDSESTSSKESTDGVTETIKKAPVSKPKSVQSLNPGGDIPTGMMQSPFSMQPVNVNLTTGEQMNEHPVNTSFREQMNGSPVNASFRQLMIGSPVNPSFRQQTNGSPLNTSFRHEMNGSPVNTSYRQQMNGSPANPSSRHLAHNLNDSVKLNGHPNYETSGTPINVVHTQQTDGIHPSHLNQTASHLHHTMHQPMHQPMHQNMQQPMQQSMQQTVYHQPTPQPMQQPVYQPMPQQMQHPMQQPAPLQQRPAMVRDVSTMMMRQPSMASIGNQHHQLNSDLVTVNTAEQSMSRQTTPNPSVRPVTSVGRPMRSVNTPDEFESPAQHRSPSMPRRSQQRSHSLVRNPMDTEQSQRSFGIQQIGLGRSQRSSNMDQTRIGDPQRSTRNVGRNSSLVSDTDSNNAATAAANIRKARIAQYRSATDLSASNNSRGDGSTAQSPGSGGKVQLINSQLLEDTDLMETVVPQGEIGIILVKTPDGLKIHRISDNSVAKDLRKGDIIISLDGVDVS